jgi:hypothetical protein
MPHAKLLGWTPVTRVQRRKAIRSWAAGIDGDVGVGGLPPQEVNATFSDILQHFDLGFTGAAEARKGRFSVAADLVWAKISAESGTPLGIIADKVELTTDMVMATGVAGYSLISSEEANLDVIAGARLWSITNDLEIKGGKIGSASADDNQTWIDPVVGFKGRANLTPDIYVMGWGLVGGFGVSSSSCGTPWRVSDMTSTRISR